MTALIERVARAIYDAETVDEAAEEVRKVRLHRFNTSVNERPEDG